MANPQYQAFQQTGKASLMATAVSQSVLLPTGGTPTCAVVTNLGTVVAWVLFGTTSAVAATSANAFPILPFQSFTFSLTTNTYMAAIGQGPLDIAMGI